jgi:hypothetical protein
VTASLVLRVTQGSGCRSARALRRTSSRRE